MGSADDSSSHISYPEIRVITAVSKSCWDWPFPEGTLPLASLSSQPHSLQCSTSAHPGPHPKTAGSRDTKGLGGLVLGSLPDPSVSPSDFQSIALSRWHASCQEFEDAEQHPLLGSGLIHTFDHPFRKMTVSICAHYVPSNVSPCGNATVNYMQPPFSQLGRFHGCLATAQKTFWVLIGARGI